MADESFFFAQQLAQEFRACDEDCCVWSQAELVETALKKNAQLLKNEREIEALVNTIMYLDDYDDCAIDNADEFLSSLDTYDNALVAVQFGFKYQSTCGVKLDQLWKCDGAPLGRHNFTLVKENGRKDVYYVFQSFIQAYSMGDFLSGGKVFDANGQPVRRTWTEQDVRNFFAFVNDLREYMQGPNRRLPKEEEVALFHALFGVSWHDSFFGNVARKLADVYYDDEEYEETLKFIGEDEIKLNFGIHAMFIDLSALASATAVNHCLGCESQHR